MYKENQTKPLIILGAGGFAREVYTWLEHKNVLFFSHTGTGYIKEKKIINDLTPYAGHRFIAALGQPNTRKDLFNLAKSKGLICDRILVRPEATLIDDEIVIGDGSIICPGVRLTTDIVIGKSVILNLNCTVGHDTIIEDFVTVSPGAFISGNCKIGKGAYIGTGASIREGVTIGEGAVVGMGAAVVKDVPPGKIYGGVPARELK